MAAKRYYLAALVLTCLFGLGHFAGFLQASIAARKDPSMADLTQAMRNYRTNVLGFRPSILDFREYFSLNFSVLLFLVAALGWVGLRSAADQQAGIKLLSACYVVAMVVLTGTSLWFSVIQGVVSCLLIGLLFGLAWWSAS